MDRREFLKKQVLRGRSSAGPLWCICFFANQDSSSKKAYDGDEDISFYGKHQAGITTPMQKALLLGGVRSSHDGQKKSSSFLKTGLTIVVN